MYLFQFIRLVLLYKLFTISEWEKLASSTKGLVTVAYWDTEGGSRPPRLLGEYKGTPTIRLFTPKKKQKKKGSNAEKNVLDYSHGERNVKDMKKFLEYQIPNFVERIKFGVEDYMKIKNKADKYGLPIALLFTSKSKSTTSTSIKWLSTEYRRRLLIVEIPPVDKNSKLWKLLIGGGDSNGHGGDKDEKVVLPALYIIPPSTTNDDNNNNSDDNNNKSKIITYEGDDYKRRKLQDFFNEHSLKEPAFEPIETTIVKDDDGNDDNDNDNDASSAKPQQSKEDNNNNNDKKKKESSSPGGDEF